MAKHGILVDYDWCTGCHSCEVACQMEHGLPVDQYGIKVMELGPWSYCEGKWQITYFPVFSDQCNLCAERTAQGKLPSCVHHCQAQCLTYGPLEELAQKLAEHPKQALFSLK